MRAATEVLVQTVGFQGPRGLPGAGGSTFTRTARGPISALRIVVPFGEVDEVAYADPTDPAGADRPHWLTMGSALDGQPLEVARHGEIEEQGWSWTPGATLYLGANGTLSETPPSLGYILQVGIAEGPDAIFFDPRIPIVIS